MKTQTACRIVRIKHVEIPPAIAEVETSLGERFPIFDRAVRDEAITAMDAGVLVLPELYMCEGVPFGYVRHLHQIDPSAESMICQWCDYPTMPRSESDTPSFVCPKCSRRIYLQPVPAVELHLPTQARARLDRWHDGLFTLDHERSEAIFTRTVNGSTSHMPPYGGVCSQLEPHAEAHVETTLAGLSLRLTASPFNGREIYKVV